MKKLLLYIAAAALAIPASAETVLLDEDFDGDYTKSFGFFYDGDRLDPHPSISGLFYSAATEGYMPWWLLRESAGDTDRFMGSHSYYEEPGTSEDWMISQPITIDSEGYVLTFDAQSVVLRSGDRLSDLMLFITDDYITPGDLPVTPDHVWPQIPAGPTPDVTTGEWVHLSYSLDAYAGRTVIINFVNRNTDKDILCIDNVKVARQDMAIITLDPVPAYCSADKIVLTATVESIVDIPSWKVTFSDGNASESIDGEAMAAGQKSVVSVEFPIAVDTTVDYSVVLSVPGTHDITVKGSTSRTAFDVTRRVLLEESTGTWCGNCPFGWYNIECLTEDPALAGLVIPVSVHVDANQDIMAFDSYGTLLGAGTSAPLVSINREGQLVGFIPAYDSAYDPTNPQSFAYKVVKALDKPSPLAIDVAADWVIENGDTTAINCTATVRPALSLTGTNYRVGFILTENNVGIDNSPFWVQHNYFSDLPYESKLGGWTLLGETVRNVRFQDVARGVSSFSGSANSVPADLVAGSEYTFSFTMPIPNTERRMPSGDLAAKAIQTEMCMITAFIVDVNDDGAIANCARIPMSDIADNRFTIADLLEAAGIADISVGGRSEGCFDLLGRPVDADKAAPGTILIRRNADGSAEKLLVR